MKSKIELTTLMRPVTHHSLNVISALNCTNQISTTSDANAEARAVRPVTDSSDAHHNHVKAGIGEAVPTIPCFGNLILGRHSDLAAEFLVHTTEFAGSGLSTERRLGVLVSVDDS